MRFNKFLNGRAKRLLISGLSLLLSTALFPQRNIPPTDSLQIFGQIKHPIVFSLTQLDAFAKTSINTQVIYNHKGEIKDTLTGIAGVPLKLLLAKVEYAYEKPKELNEFYFVFTASDGYKVVLSWNEIYNTETGNNFYIITELQGKRQKQINERIAFISTADIQTGRRYIKGLKQIEVNRLK